jgi:hypothetical protein
LVQEHHPLLKISEDVIGALKKTLLHPDLHKRNIFVSDDDPTIITSIIDWQSICIEPAFAFASDTPDLVNRNSAPVSLHDADMKAKASPRRIQKKTPN